MAPVRKETPRETYPKHDYLIYFLDRDERNWWDYIFRTRPGFRHCFVTHWCEWSNRWLVIDWRQSRTDIEIMFGFEMECLVRGIEEQKGTVVRFQASRESGIEGALITYCSNMIGRFIGFGNKLILTPYGLYRTLLKSGGEVVYCWSDEHE